MFEHKEDDNLNMEEIERYRKMSQEERDELMKELEKEEKEKIAELKSKGTELNSFAFLLPI